MDNVRKRIQSALAAIPAIDFLTTAKNLLEVLGYRSDRILELSGSVDEFIHEFQTKNQNTQTEKAFRRHVRSVRLVFQVTSDEIASFNQPMLGFEDHSFDKGQQQSFIFFAVELKEVTYARGQYAQFTREINKRLNQPSVVMFRTADNLLSLAFVRRRKHRRNQRRDVLGHVSLIREINLAKPHRAHLDILEDLSLENCLQWMDLHGKQPNFDGLLAAWLNTLDTEELNRRFYGELFDWFKRAAAEAKFPSTVLAEQQVIRLITRILFVWFIKEKGLVREEWFVPAEMKKLLNDFGGSDYYRAVLQNLFFATLNTEMGLRGFSTRTEPSHRVFSRFRYQSLIRDTERFEDLMKQTPFINGGLFDCLDDEESRSAGGRRVDMFSDPDPSDGPRAAEARREAWRELNVPDALFFDKDYGLFPLLEDYKFTVEENTPIEQEVALDPELLGKVFENLLAAYNPETSETVRKQTGSYYTPRAVVDYMVEEALVATLVEKAQPNDGDTDSWQERLRDLMDYADAFNDVNDLFKEVEKKRIVKAIEEIKVLDPAVGSGAFPMGILHKLTLVLQRIDPDNKRWEELQKERATRRAAAAFDTPNQQERDDELTEISDTFERYRDSDFGRKLYLIQNSIYGVDIQPVACQIAKLRFFISLAIEQEVDETADNFGIKPLPNLETRFVAANTLLSLDKPAAQMSLGQTDAVNQLEQKLNENRERYFHATTRKQKLDYRKKDAELRGELAAELEGASFSPDAAKKIARWDAYDQNAKADWFDAGYMFGITDGFDVVIGNPPYVRQEKIKEHKPALKNQYDCYVGTADLYVYFYERGLQMLRDDGVLTYISPNKYFRSAYGKKLRDFLTRQATLSQLIDFGDAPIFTSIAYPSIIIIYKTRTEGNHLRALNWGPGLSIDEFGAIFRTKSFTMPQKALTADGWRLASPAVLNLLKKLRNAGEPLGEYVKGRFYYGIKTGLNEAFVVDRATRDKLIADHPSSAEVLKPFLRGRDVKRWQVDSQDLWLIFTRRGIDIEKFPAIYEHLYQYKKRLTPGVRGGRKSGNYQWYEIQDAIDYWEEFEQPKIILGRFMNKATFAFDKEAFFHNDALYMIAGMNEYVVAILNSSVSWWFLCQICTDLQNGYLQAFRENLFQIPVPFANTEQQSTIIRLVDYLIYLKKQPSADSKNLAYARDYVMIKYFEQIIDGLVYELYLTDELHHANKYFFEPLLNDYLPPIREVSGDKMSALRDIFERLFDRKHPVRRNLFFLNSLETIRIIEDKV